MKNSGATVNRILLVEDEPAICEVCDRVLTGEGFKVDIAANGRIAQYMIAKRQYDLYLFDIRLPTMNGKELYYWLREKQPKMTSRVIFATGDVFGGDTQSFLEQTTRPFLCKPFTPNELRTIIRETLEKVEK